MVGRQQTNKRPDRCLNVQKKTPKKAPQNESMFTIRGSDYKPTVIFELLMIATVVVQFYLYQKYVGDPLVIMTEFNLLNIWFCVIGRYMNSGAMQLGEFVGIKWWVKIEDKNGKTKPMFIDYRTTGFWDIGLGAVLFIILLITQALLKPIKLNVAPFDAFLFYVFSAPAEEALFRFFLTATPIIIGMKIIEFAERKCPGEHITAWKEITLKIVVATVTGLSFGLVHGRKYFGGELIAVIVNGLELSFFYAFTKRIDVVLIAHLLVNLSFGVTLLTGAA